MLLSTILPLDIRPGVGSLDAAADVSRAGTGTGTGCAAAA